MLDGGPRQRREPRQTQGLIPRLPPAHRLPRHPQRRSDLRHRRTRQHRKNSPVPLLDNRQLHQRQSRPPHTHRNDTHRKAEHGHCQPSAGTEVSSIYRDRTDAGQGGAFRFSLRGSRRASPAGAGRRRRRARRSIGRPATPTGGEPPRQPGVIQGRRSGNRPGRRADRNRAPGGASCRLRPSYGRIAGTGPTRGPTLHVRHRAHRGGGRRRLRRGAKLPAPHHRPIPPTGARGALSDDRLRIRRRLVTDLTRTWLPA